MFRNFLSYLRNKHGLWFKLFVLGCSLLLIVFLLPNPNYINFNYELNRPWQNEDLVAPFDFAVYKNDAEIKEEKKNIRGSEELYYLDNDSAFKSRINEVFQKEKLGKNEADILRQVFNALLSKKIIEQPDSALPAADPVIIILKNKEAKEARLHDFYSMLQADSFLVVSLKEELPEERTNYLIEISEAALAHTLSFDKAFTRQNLQQQLSSVVLIKDKRLKGQSVIKRGDVVDEGKAGILLSLQKEINKKDNNVNESLVARFGKIVYVALCLMMVFVFLALFRTGIFGHDRRVAFIFIMICIFVLCCSLVARRPSLSIYAIPFAIVPVVIRTFFDTRTALFVHLNVILLCALYTAGQKFNFLFIELLSGIGAIFSVANLSRRSQLLITACVTFIISILSFFAIKAAVINEVSWADINPFIFASVGLLLAYPFIYLFEKTFGFISDFTLLELNDIGSNNLLKRMASEAPGTFQHSLQVAAMAEEAVELVGGKALLVRTGAMYHDIGKLNHPFFFTENQSSKTNPLDDFSYEDGARIIINHVIDGIDMAHKERLPEQIVDFIRTHHGTTLASYFYYKALEENPDTKNREKLFRYKGPIPFSKETAVLMLADSVEASSRSLKTYDALSIDDLVERIFKYKMDENQLINSDLTLRDLTSLKKMFKKRLMNMYHVRIEYPKQL